VGGGRWAWVVVERGALFVGGRSEKGAWASLLVLPAHANNNDAEIEKQHETKAKPKHKKRSNGRRRRKSFLKKCHRKWIKWEHVQCEPILSCPK